MPIPAPEVTVTAWWNLAGSGSDFWTVEDPVRGALDEYEIAGDLETDITEYVLPGISITRGRDRQTGEISPGTTILRLNNRLRTFDPFNTAGPFYGNIVPGKKFTIRIDGIDQFTGKSVDYDYATEHGALSYAEVPIYDSLRALAAAELDSWTPAAGTASEQINEALDRPEVNFGANRNIVGGVSTLGAYPVDQGTKVLGFAQLAARSDLGRFFADRQDIVVFQDRNTTIPDGDNPVTVFADDGTSIPFARAEISYGSDVLFTRTVVSRIGGSTEIVDNLEAADLYGQISTEDIFTDLLLADDEQSTQMAVFLASTYSDPELRISAITIRLGSIPTVLGRAQVLTLDIGSLISVTYTPDGIGDPIERYCVVEGVRIDIRRKFEVDVLLLLGDVLQFGVWTVEDALLGALDESPIAF